MQIPYELLAGLRYTRSKRSNRAISFITFIAMISMVLGVVVLVTVMSVMNGFDYELRTRILGMASHATISAVNGNLEDWTSVAAVAAKNPQVEAEAPYVDGQAMLREGSDLSGTMLRGIDPAREQKVSDIGSYMKAGKLEDLQPGQFKMVIGSELAQILGVGVGDQVDLMIPMATATPAGILPRFRRFTVCGIFEAGMADYDRGLVLLNLQDAAVLYRMGEGVTGVRLKLHDMFKAPEVAQQIALQLPGLYYVNDWTREHVNFFKAVAQEKVVMFLILSLIVLVAVINIVSMLSMVVQEKRADIAILRTLGAAPRSIMAVFMVQGSVIGFVGTFIGVVLGVLLALNVTTLVPLLQKLTGHQFLSPDIYYISDVPSRLELSDVVNIGAMSLILGLLSTLYPAWRASRVLPAEALRYE